MKKIFKILTTFFAGIFMVTSCSPEEFRLGSVDVKPGDLVPGIAYKVESDPQNPNIVHLTSLMDEKFQPLWDHPQGRSLEKTVSLRIPFPGTYSVKFGVQTRGGVVYGEPSNFTVANFYAPFVEDPLWELLSGGVDKEKVWVLDLDEDGLSRHFNGPLYFYGTDDSWATVTKGKTVEGDSWNWSPDYKGNSWLMDTGDYGTMTFDLKGAANVRVNHNMLSGRGTEVGKYMIDTENKTMRLNDASPLHDRNRDGQVVDWGNLRIMSLTKDFMQLGVIRDEALSGEGPALLVYNYISKEFKDNWVPGNVAEPEPPYTGDANGDLTTSTTTSKKWVLSTNNPYDWASLAGDMLNGWSTPQDYANTRWAPYDASLIKNISLTLNKTGDKGGTYTFTDGGGVPINGSYTIEEKNHIKFDKDISFTISGWVSLATTADKMLRILKTELDASGNVKGIWLGQRDPVKPEYFAYHFVPGGSGAAADPTAAWKTALVGKTFKPDVNWFADWVGGAPAFAGGWTSASTFGSDYTTNGWVWTKEVRDVAESATLRFFEEGGNVKVELKQKKEGKDFSAVGTVKIDPEKSILNINIPLVDYVGTAGSWLNTKNTKSTTGNEFDWHFVSHGGSNLSNINTNGFWLGAVTGSVAAGDAKDEVLIFHFVKTD